MAQTNEASLYEKSMDRVAAMTAAGQQRGEYKDDEHERFALHSRIAHEDGQFGHTLVAD